MLCRKNAVKCGAGSVPVLLNVYDLTSVNGYAYWLGLGVYHSGVEVHGVEYAFGAHEYPTTGIFEGEPRKCEGFTFRKAILVGWTEKGPLEVRRVMEQLAGVYKGNAYNLITKNCNHFCNDACLKLTGKPIPSWVNRLARIGMFCNCIVPVSLSSTKVRHQQIDDKILEGDKKVTTSLNSSSSSSSSPTPPTSRSRSSGSVLPSSPSTDAPSSS
ncbi:hypothetical protein NMG60_11004832 [Bertholletia excelsa]